MTGMSFRRINTNLHLRHGRHSPAKNRGTTASHTLLKTAVKYLANLSPISLRRCQVVIDRQRIVKTRSRNQGRNNLVSTSFVCLFRIRVKTGPQRQAIVDALLLDEVGGGLGTRRRILSESRLDRF